MKEHRSVGQGRGGREKARKVSWEAAAMQSRGHRKAFFVIEISYRLSGHTFKECG